MLVAVGARRPSCGMRTPSRSKIGACHPTANCPTARGNPVSEPNWLIWWILELEDLFRLQTVIRPCRSLPRTALLARQPCVRQFFDNCPIRAGSRFCRAHPYTDKSRRCDSRNTLEVLTEPGRSLARRSPRSAPKTLSGRWLIAWRPPACRARHYNNAKADFSACNSDGRKNGVSANRFTRRVPAAASAASPAASIA